MLPYTRVCKAYKDHAKLSTEKYVHSKCELAEFEKPWLEVTSFLSHKGGQEIKAKIDEKEVLENWVDHGGELSRRRIVPIHADVI